MSPEQEVIAAAEERAAALVRRDKDALQRLMHPRLRWTTRLGLVLDRESYIDGNTSGSLNWRGQRLESPEVVVVGDAAILTATVVDEVEEAGDRQTFRLRLTQTWVRDQGTWQCLSGHASSPS